MATLAAATPTMTITPASYAILAPEAIARSVALADRYKTPIVLYGYGDTDASPAQDDSAAPRYYMSAPLGLLASWLGLTDARAVATPSNWSATVGPEALAALGWPEGMGEPCLSLPHVAFYCIDGIQFQHHAWALSPEAVVHYRLLASRNPEDDWDGADLAEEDYRQWTDVTRLDQLALTLALGTMFPDRAIHNIEHQVVWLPRQILVAGLNEPLDYDPDSRAISWASGRMTVDAKGHSVTTGGPTLADDPKLEQHRQELVTGVHHCADAESAWTAVVCAPMPSANPYTLIWPHLVLRTVEGGRTLDLTTPMRWQGFGRLWPHQTFLQVTGLSSALTVELEASPSAQTVTLKARMTRVSAHVMCQLWTKEPLHPSPNCDTFDVVASWNLQTGGYRGKLVARAVQGDDMVQFSFATTLRLIVSEWPAEGTSV